MTVAAVRALIGDRTALVSRGLPATFVADLRLAGVQVTEIPVVRGVAAPPALARDEVFVGGHPNELGRFDPAPAGAVVLVAEEASERFRPLPAHAEAVRVPAAARWRDPEAAVRRARRLARAAAQIRGVRLAHDGDVPVLVLLLPVCPAGVDAEVALPTAPLVDRPEFPGGIRVVVPDAVDRDAIAAYAAALAAFVERRRVGP